VHRAGWKQRYETAEPVWATNPNPFLIRLAK